MVSSARSGSKWPRRIAAINTAIGLSGRRRRCAAADRARCGLRWPASSSSSEHGREPIDARELAGQIAKDSRPRTQTVAGYDLTFSPVKSVSTLWAVADPAVAAVIEQAHQAAVKDALSVYRDACPVHPDRATRHPAGQRPRPRRGRVHAPRQPGRRPGPAHPRRGSEQGADPRRTVAVHRRAGACSKPTLPPRRHTTPRSSSTFTRPWGCGSPNGPAPIRRSGRSGRSSGSTPD